MRRFGWSVGMGIMACFMAGCVTCRTKNLGTETRYVVESDTRSTQVVSEEVVVTGDEPKVTKESTSPKKEQGPVDTGRKTTTERKKTERVIKPAQPVVTD